MGVSAFMGFVFFILGFFTCVTFFLIPLCLLGLLGMMWKEDRLVCLALQRGCFLSSSRLVSCAVAVAPRPGGVLTSTGWVRLPFPGFPAVRNGWLHQAIRRDQRPGRENSRNINTGNTLRTPAL